MIWETHRFFSIRESGIAHVLGPADAMFDFLVQLRIHQRGEALMFRIYLLVCRRCYTATTLAGDGAVGCNCTPNERTVARWLPDAIPGVIGDGEVWVASFERSSGELKQANSVTRIAKAAR